MREHLFKGFHPCDNGTVTITLDGKQIKGEWVEGYYIKEKIYDGDILLDKTHEVIFDGDCAFEIFPETVCEYWLDDKNGNKIFDNDIVNDGHGNIGVVKYSTHFHNLRVHWYKGREDLSNEIDRKFGREIFCWVHEDNILERIGTIFSDAELLGGAE